METATKQQACYWNLPRFVARRLLRNCLGKRYDDPKMICLCRDLSPTEVNDIDQSLILMSLILNLSKSKMSLKKSYKKYM